MEANGSVAGKNQRHDVLLLGLSTCVWCRKTRELLETEGIAFRFAYLDLLQGDDKASRLELLRTWNPRESYPTVIIDERTCVIGYKPDDLREALS